MASGFPTVSLLLLILSTGPLCARAQALGDSASPAGLLSYLGNALSQPLGDVVTAPVAPPEDVQQAATVPGASVGLCTSGVRAPSSREVPAGAEGHFNAAGGCSSLSRLLLHVFVEPAAAPFVQAARVLKTQYLMKFALATMSPANTINAINDC